MPHGAHPLRGESLGPRLMRRLGDFSLGTQAALLAVCGTGAPLAALSVGGALMLYGALESNAERLVEAQVSSLAVQLDEFHRGRQRDLHHLAAQPAIVAYCRSDEANRLALAPGARGTMDGFLRADDDLLIAAVLDASGRALVSTNPAVEGIDASSRSFILDAMAGRETISDMFRSLPVAGSNLLINYTVPLFITAGAPACILSLGVRAGSIQHTLESAEAFAGKDSVALALDQYGVRVGHSKGPDFILRPTGPIPTDERAKMVTEGRFGTQTTALLDSVVDDPALYALARAPTLAADEPAFWSWAPSSGKQSLTVVRRLSVVPWTVAARVPDDVLMAPVRDAVARLVLLDVVALVVAVALTMAALRTLTSRVDAMALAADALGRGELGARIADPSNDELGRVGARFNAMAVAFEQRRANANRVQSEFLSNMSNELRTPLDAVIGFADLLLDDEKQSLSARQSECIVAIAAAGRQQLALVNDVLDFSKIEAGRVKLEPEWIRVDELMARVQNVIALQAASEHVTITLRNGGVDTLWADPRRLHQVLLNLVENAVKFSPENSVVELVCGAVGSEVVFEVLDRGPGIPSEMSPRLFTPFQRAESPGVETNEGTGLGLAICRGLVRLHGGEIAARPREGGGSVFEVRLPAADFATDTTPARLGT